MCTICEHPSESNNIDDLLEAYERQQQEAYINKTIPVIDELSDIAYRLADAYEKEYRANPIYENEERMHYWRYMGAEHWYSKSDGLYYTPYREYKQRKKEYEELIRKHREATKPTNEEHRKKKRTLTNDELNAFLFIGLTGSMIATPIFAMIFLYLVVRPR